MRHVILLLIIFFGPNDALSAESEIDVIFESEGEFEVLYHRAMSTATGAVIGGLIGAAVEEGVRSNDDQEKEDALTQYLEDDSCYKRFLDSLTSKLESRNYKIVSIEAKRTKSLGENVLEIDIKNCGFKMVDSYYRKVSAFIRFDVKYFPATNAEAQIDESFLIFGKKSYTYMDLLNSEVDASLEFIDVLERGGKRLANRIIYLR